MIIIVRKLVLGIKAKLAAQQVTVVNGEANIKDAKLVIDSFVQNTKTITFSVYNTSQRMITLPTYFIVEKYVIGSIQVYQIHSIMLMIASNY